MFGLLQGMLLCRAIDLLLVSIYENSYSNLYIFRTKNILELERSLCVTQSPIIHLLVNFYIYSANGNLLYLVKGKKYASALKMNSLLHKL